MSRRWCHGRGRRLTNAARGAELGGDFTFVGRQRRLRVGDAWYRVDLLFYHRRLRCLIVIDLKLGKFTHADAGQMHLYLNYAREHWTMPGENPHTHAPRSLTIVVIVEHVAGMTVPGRCAPLSPPSWCSWRATGCVASSGNELPNAAQAYRVRACGRLDPDRAPRDRPRRFAAAANVEVDRRADAADRADGKAFRSVATLVR